MAKAIFLPKIGMTMEEGTLSRWLLADGAPVARGQPLFELETAKAIVEVEADGAGTLRRLAAEGATLAPGAVVGCLLAEGETEVPADILAQTPDGASASVTPEAAAAPAVGPPASQSAGADTGGRAVASPAARRLARELGVDLAQVAGSGPGRRVVEADIRAAAAGTVSSPPAPALPVASGPVASTPTPPPAAATSGTREPYAGRRRLIGQRMHESLQSMAQLTLSSETRVDAALEMLHGLNREWRSERVVVTLPVLVLRACALALREHPRLNARLDGAEVVLQDEVYIGLAVDDDAGLVVPVVRDADRASLQQTARTVADLVERTKDRRVTPDELTGGTFTVTALDGTVVDAFTPVINPPQAAILGLGRVRETAVIEDGAVRAGRVTTLSLTFDHRVLDGAPAARFLARIAELLARPYLLM